MKTILLHKKYTFFLLLFLFTANTLIAQIGVNTTSPSPDSMLDVESTDKGILIPRVDIADLSTIAPITGGSTESLLVYNTNTTTGKGFYYWDGAWINIDNGDWELNGNAGTNPTNNFIGTTDNQDFVIRTNNTERMRLLSAGNVGVAAVPLTNVALRVNDNTHPFGIFANADSNNVSIFAIQSGNGQAIRGINNGAGFGVVGESAVSHGILGATGYAGSGTAVLGGVIGWGAGANNASGVLAVVPNVATTGANVGLRVISGSTTFIQPTGIRNMGINANAINLGLNVLTTSNSGVREAARFQTNFDGAANNSDSRDMLARLAGFRPGVADATGLVEDMYYGGYFYSGGATDGAWAYAGARHGATNYKIIGIGTVSTIVDGANKNDTKKVMFASEAPEVLFEDYGTGKLVNGTATITIDPVFSNNITVNEKHPLRVFIQLEGDCKGVYVTNKTANSFVVKELQNGNSSTSFSWHIVANRKNEIDSKTNEVTVYESLRFPNAPSKIEAEAMENRSVKGVEEVKIKPLELKGASPTKN